MSLNTSLKGRLRNTNLPKTHALLPLFEAVVNSIHSIDSKQEGQFLDSDKIVIKIQRTGQLSLVESIKGDLNGFEIIDTGVGFNDDNYNSFKTLDSDYKIELGCRGVGRLVWLKAFDNVLINSVFSQGEVKLLRKFDFNHLNDIHNISELTETKENISTKIVLSNIKKEYLKYLPKTIQIIARDLLEHCLWYFIREGGVPNIYIEDGNEKILLQDMYEELMLDASASEKFELHSESFEILHVKLKSSVQNKHTLIFSAANRVVQEETLVGKIPGLFGVLSDGENEFSYTCFLTSTFLTENVNSERVGFNLMENAEGIFENKEISIQSIRKKTIEYITLYLEDYLSKNKEEGIQRLASFVDDKAPRYKPIVKRMSEVDKIVNPNISDKELDIKLHGHLMEFEMHLLEEGHDLMTPKSIENAKDYKDRISEYLAKCSDLKQSDLANYVSHRRVILDLLERAIQITPNGKYLREDIIHRLIMPMRIESEDIRFEDSNLWLIDERLAFHNFLASDKSLKSIPITSSDSAKEPDLLGINFYGNPLLVNDGSILPLASITIVEIKRPMRNDAKAGENKDPIEQALGYLKRVREGKVETQNGRLIPNSNDIPGFCYIICDITDSVKNRCELFNLKVTHDKLGYFGYNENLKAYIEVISFDRLLNRAKDRNKAFFDKLGLPTK